MILQSSDDTVIGGTHDFCLVQLQSTLTLIFTKARKGHLVAFSVVTLFQA